MCGSSPFAGPDGTVDIARIGGFQAGQRNRGDRDNRNPHFIWSNRYNRNSFTRGNLTAFDLKHTPEKFADATRDSIA